MLVLDSKNSLILGLLRTLEINLKFTFIGLVSLIEEGIFSS